MCLQPDLRPATHDPTLSANVQNNVKITLSAHNDGSCVTGLSLLIRFMFCKHDKWFHIFKSWLCVCVGVCVNVGGPNYDHRMHRLAIMHRHPATQLKHSPKNSQKKFPKHHPKHSTGDKFTWEIPLECQLNIITDGLLVIYDLSMSMSILYLYKA